MPTSSRELQRLEVWRALQRAAIDLVDQRGFVAVTVDDIAAEAGVSRRTFFNHFPTKAAALFDPDPADAELLHSLLADIDGSAEPWKDLQRVCVQFVAAHEPVVAVRHRLVIDSPELDQYHRTAQRHLPVALEQWLRHQPGLTPFAALLMAETAGAILISAFMAWRPEQDADALLDLIADGFKALGRGLDA